MLVSLSCKPDLSSRPSWLTNKLMPPVASQAVAELPSCSCTSSGSLDTRLSEAPLRVILRRNPSTAADQFSIAGMTPVPAERRRVDDVIPEIAEEVSMLLKHDGSNTSAREQHSQHHAGGPADDDATGGFKNRSHQRRAFLGIGGGRDGNSIFGTSAQNSSLSGIATRISGWSSRTLFTLVLTGCRSERRPTWVTNAAARHRGK